MSDTVKLIIEIDPNIIYAIHHNKGVTLKNQIDMCNAIKNGIPLNDVKAEMEKHQFSREYCCEHNIDSAIDMGMVRIILDNISKAESEE